MNPYEISRELSELDAYVKSMDAVTDMVKYMRMLRIAESWRKYLWNEQMTRMSV